MASIVDYHSNTSHVIVKPVPAASYLAGSVIQIHPML